MTLVPLGVPVLFVTFGEFQLLEHLGCRLLSQILRPLGSLLIGRKLEFGNGNGETFRLLRLNLLCLAHHLLVLLCVTAKSLVGGTRVICIRGPHPSRVGFQNEVTSVWVFQVTDFTSLWASSQSILLSSVFIFSLQRLLSLLVCSVLSVTSNGGNMDLILCLGLLAGKQSLMLQPLSSFSVVRYPLTFSQVGKLQTGLRFRGRIQITLYQLLNNSHTVSMINVLNIAEKNSVAKEIAKHLSQGSSTTGRTLSKFNPVFEFNIPDMNYRMKVSSVRGHVIEYTFPDRYRVWKNHNPRIFFKEVECLIKPNDDMKELVDNLKSLARGIDLLVLWLDCDRQGEAIAFEVIQLITSVTPRVQIKRAKFSAVTFQDVWSAFRNLIEPNRFQADAVNYRREVDLRLGVSFTIFQTLTLQKENGVDGTVSYGPCQFPTLGFVVERYLKIKNFVPEKYWMIKAFFVNEETRQKIEFKWRRNRLFCELSAHIMYLDMIESFPDCIPIAKVFKEDKAQKKKFKPYPLATIELQKIGTKKLGMSSAKIMEHAEKLYQKGFLSYPRTQTTSYPNTMDLLKFVRNFQENGHYQNYANQLLNQGKYMKPRNGNKNDNAHPPIHPVKAASRQQMTDQQWKVYDLISRHFLGSCSKDAEAEQRIVNIRICEEQFFATHLTVTAYNYLEIYTFQKWTESTIPAIPAQFYPLVCFEVSQTSPPGYMTEAQLIGTMDRNQIGTDSTIHQHIKTIQDRSYAVKTNNSFKPTPLGLALVVSYNEMGIELSNCWVRRNIEINMNQIAAQRMMRQDAVNRTIDQMIPLYDKLQSMKNRWVSLMRTHLPESMAEVVFDDTYDCARCGRPMLQDSGSLTCVTCGTRLTLPSGNYTKTEFHCPICQFHVLEVIKKKKKFPQSICPMCYNHPPQQYKADPFATLMECDNCTYVCPKARGSFKKDLFLCPLCKSKVTLKSAGTGTRFLGCSAYPACRWSRGLAIFVKGIRILSQVCRTCEEQAICAFTIDQRLVQNIDLLVKLTEKTQSEINLCINPECNPVLFEEERRPQSSDASVRSRIPSQPTNCWKCQKPGHYANNCPTLTSQHDTIKHKGSRSQYTTVQKNKGKKASSQKGSSVSSFKVTCYACNKQGHIAPNCPQKNLQSTNPPHPPNQKGCAMCGTTGRHPKGSSCPGLKKNKSKG